MGYTKQNDKHFRMQNLDEVIPQKKGFNMLDTKNLTLKKFQENFDFQNLSFL